MIVLFGLSLVLLGIALIGVVLFLWSVVEFLWLIINRHYQKHKPQLFYKRRSTAVALLIGSLCCFVGSVGGFYLFKLYF